MRSGLPFSVTNGNVDANLDGSTNDRAQLVGDPPRLLRRGGEHAHGHPSVVGRRAFARPAGGDRATRPAGRLRLDGLRRMGRGNPVPPLPCAGQPGRDRRTRRADDGCPTLIHGEHDRLRVDGPHARRVGTAEREDGLVGVAPEQHRGRAAP
jgi:hypothetical protein